MAQRKPARPLVAKQGGCLWKRTLAHDSSTCRRGGVDHVVVGMMVILSCLGTSFIRHPAANDERALSARGLRKDFYMQTRQAKREKGWLMTQRRRYDHRNSNKTNPSRNGTISTNAGQNGASHDEDGSRHTDHQQRLSPFPGHSNHHRGRHEREEAHAATGAAANSTEEDAEILGENMDYWHKLFIECYEEELARERQQEKDQMDLPGEEDKPTLPSDMLMLAPSTGEYSVLQPKGITDELIARTGMEAKGSLIASQTRKESILKAMRNLTELIQVKLPRLALERGWSKISVSRPHEIARCIFDNVLNGDHRKKLGLSPRENISPIRFMTSAQIQRSLDLAHELEIDWTGWRAFQLLNKSLRHRKRPARRAPNWLVVERRKQAAAKKAMQAGDFVDDDVTSGGVEEEEEEEEEEDDDNQKEGLSIPGLKRSHKKRKQKQGDERGKNQMEVGRLKQFSALEDALREARERTQMPSTAHQEDDDGGEEDSDYDAAAAAAAETKNEEEKEEEEEEGDGYDETLEKLRKELRQERKRAERRVERRKEAMELGQVPDYEALYKTLRTLNVTEKRAYAEELQNQMEERDLMTKSGLTVSIEGPKSSFGAALQARRQSFLAGDEKDNVLYGSSGETSDSDTNAPPEVGTMQG